MTIIKRLQSKIRGLIQEKIMFNKTISELKFTMESNAEFNEKTQAKSRESSEMVLYYQQTLYEMLEQTGML